MATPLPTAQNNNKQALLGVDLLFKKSWEVFVSHFTLFVGVLTPAFIVSVISNFFPFNFWKDLFVIGVSIWASLAFLYAIKERDQGISAVQALQKGVAGFLPFAWILILDFFIIWGGFMLFIVPGVLLSVWFFFAQYAFVVEGKKGMHALLRSKDLAAGYTWQVFLRLLAIVLAWLVVLVSTILLLEKLGIGRPLLTFDSEMVGQSFFVGDTILNAVGFIVSIFFAIFAFLFYENIKQVKGDPTFEAPSRKRKLKYFAVGFVGFLMLIYVLLLRLLLVSLIKTCC